MPVRLSVLLPTYAWYVRPLVTQLLAQFADVGGVDACEVLVFDDASPPAFRRQNEALGRYPGVRFRAYEENQGRARIRNRLAEAARGEWLLFLDADSAAPHGDFLRHYLRVAEAGPAPV
ncbi:MAG: glycosyltransferase family 2 protein, partial [Catalinimonas sp.]